MAPTLGLLVALLALPACTIVLASVTASTSAVVPYVRPAAVVTAAAGLALVALISLAGRAAARSRRLLLLAYVPGLYVTLAAMVALTAAHAALAIVACRLLVGLSVSGDTFGFWLLVLPTLGVLVGTVLVLMAVVDAGLGATDPPAIRTVIGAALDRADAPELWACVEDVALRMGVAVPDHLVLLPVANFEAIEPVIETGTARLEGRIIACSLPLIDVLDVDEFRAVIAHELAHFGAEHVRFRNRYLGVFQRGADVWQALAPSPDDAPDLQQLVQVPARMLLAHFVGSFVMVERQLAREAELRLDSVAAAATSRQAVPRPLRRPWSTRPCGIRWKSAAWSS